MLNKSEYHWVYNILWSDPIEDGKTAEADVFGVHDSPRGGVAAQFAWDVTKTFCARNGISLIARSHQSKQGSPGFDVMHDNLLVRVFSARDYEDHGNDGAVLSITQDGSSGCGSLLRVRPQVLRSVNKQRAEARLRSPSSVLDTDIVRQKSSGRRSRRKSEPILVGMESNDKLKSMRARSDL